MPPTPAATEPEALAGTPGRINVGVTHARPAIDKLRQIPALTESHTDIATPLERASEGAFRATELPLQAAQLNVRALTDLAVSFRAAVQSMGKAARLVVTLPSTGVTPAALVGELADFELIEAGLRRLQDAWLALPALNVASIAPRSRAYAEFVELAGWLNMTLEETADLLAVGRTTPFTWEREGREPQPRRARRLHQTHTLVGALVERFGEDGARRWLHAGRRPVFELIANGRLDEAEDRAQDLIFGQPGGASGPVNVWQPEDRDEVPLMRGPAGRRRRLEPRPLGQRGAH